MQRVSCTSWQVCDLTLHVQILLSDSDVTCGQVWCEPETQTPIPSSSRMLFFIMKIQRYYLLNMLFIFLYWMQNSSFISKNGLSFSLFPLFSLNLIFLFILDFQITKREPHFWCTMSTFLESCNFIFADNTIIWCMQIQNIIFCPYFYECFGIIY